MNDNLDRLALIGRLAFGVFIIWSFYISAVGAVNYQIEKRVIETCLEGGG